MRGVFRGIVFRRYRHDPYDSTSLNHDRVNALAMDSSGILWVGTQAGLSRLNPAEGCFVTNYTGRRTESIRHAVLSLYADPFAQLWIGTNRGLYRRRPDGSLTRFEYHEGMPSSISPGSIYSICIDHLRSILQSMSKECERLESLRTLLYIRPEPGTLNDL